MKIAKTIFSLAGAAACMTAACQFDKYAVDVNASGNFMFDYSSIEKNPQNQFYFSDEDEFYIDGIKVYYNNEEVTSDVDFIFYTTPETTYNGKTNDYIIPFIAEYDGKAAEGQLEVKIGMRGDANCDHKIALNDLVLIQNDLLQVYNTGKSSLTAQNGLGIFLANADARQTEKSVSKAYGTNLLDIGDAFYLSSYLNGKGKSVYDNVLLNNAVKLSSGEISISDKKGNAGGLVNVPVKVKTDASTGAFEITCKWNDTDLIPVGVVSANAEASVFSAIKPDSMKIWGFGINNSMNDGELLNLQFKIADNAKIGTEYDITVSNVDYFGTGSDVRNFVLTNDGTVTVSGKSTNSYLPDDSVVSDGISYDYGVRVWDAVVENGTTEVELPVMLLGGLEAKGFSMTVQCDAPLTIKKLENAASASGNSSEGITGIYESESNLNVSFETLKVYIDKNAKPGKYPVNITIKDMDNLSEDTEFIVFSGSVTVKAKSSLNGDANEDGRLNVRDCAYIATMLANGKSSQLPDTADFNGDGNINVRDAAAIAKNLAAGS